MGKLEIGIGVFKLMLPKGRPLVGYPNSNKRLNKGTNDDILVKALTFKYNDKIVASLITLDIIGIDINFTNKLRDRIYGEYNAISPDSIILCCSHTHSSGKTVGFGEEVDRDFLLELETKIINAFKDSLINFQEVKVGVGKGLVDFGHNRRVIENNIAKNIWLDLERKHTGPVDKEVGVIEFVNNKNEPVALIVNYSCHPVVMGPGNLYVSADFVGYLRNFLEDSIKGIEVFYTTGAGADINPYDCIQEDFSKAKSMGEGIGKEVLRVLKTIKAEDVREVKFYSNKIKFEPRKDINKERFKDRELELNSEIDILIINDIILVSLPGEPMVEIGLKIKEIFKKKKAFILGYANDYLGYLCPDKSIPQGGHEVRSASSHNVEKPILECVKRYIN